MRVKNKSYKSKKQAQRKAMQLKRQDEQYKEQEMKETAQRIASYRDDEAYTQNENQDAQKRMNKLRAIPSFKITEKERDKKRKSQKRLQSEFKEKEQEKKREKRKVVENREAVFRKEQEQKEEKRKLAKEKRDALNLKRLAEKQAKKNAVYNFQQTQLKSLNEKIRNLDGKFTEHEINKFKRLREFINNFRRVPDNECVSCEGVFFAKNTHKFELEKYYFLFENVLIKDDSAKIISSINDFETFFTAKDGRICTTCANYWKEGKIPPVNLKCGLKINEIPDCIKELSDLEELLISPIIPFVQLVKTLKYAKFSQIGAKGAVVLIEPDQTVFLDLLPRNVNDMSRMCIELARRVDHKSTYAEGVVNVQKVLTALKYLVETPLFKEYNIRYDKQLLDAYDPECIKDNINFIPPSHPNINPLDKQNVKLIKKEQKKKSNQEPYEDENYSDANLIKVLLEIEEMENEKTIVREDFTLSTRDFFDDGIYYLPGDMHLYLYHMDSFNAVIHAFIGNYKINKSFKNLIDSNQNVESFQLLKNIIKARAKNEKEAIWTNYIIHKFESTFKFSKLMRLQSKDITTDPTNVLEVLLRDFPSLEIQAACDCGNVEINVNELITLLVPQSDEILSVAEDIESYLLKLKNLICQKCKKKIDQDLHAININNLIAVNYPSDVPKFVSKQYVTTNLTKIPIVIKFQNEKFNIISVIIHSLGHYTCLAFAPNFEVFKIGGSAFSSENMIRTMFLEENFGAHILLYLKNENITFEPKVENIQQQNEVYDEQNLFEEEMEIDSSIIGGGGFETLDKSAKNPNSLINFKLSDELFFNNSINYLPLNINVYHLCPFNSVFHSLIGNYHLNISFRQLINQNQNIEFFKLLKTITETHDGFKKQNLWINYIVNNKTFNNEFSFENSTNSSINVDNDITLVIQEFFRFFPSILTTTTCNCNKQDKYENEMMIVYRANRNIRQNLEFDLDKYFAELYIRNCSQCHEKIPLENNTFDFGAIISINLNFDEPAEFDKLSKEEKEKMSRQKREEYQMNLIPLQEIPKYINIRGEQFKLIAVIHNIPGHFTCYVIGANNEIIEIDDVPLHNKTRDVSSYTKVNPKVLFYMKVSIIGLNEQHVIQNEEKDAHDFSYNEAAILEDQQDAENEDDIREQDVDDENTLQRPINVDTLINFKLSDELFFNNSINYLPLNINVYHLCPFNSVFHSLIGNYHLNMSFRQLINQNQNIEFFKLLKTITETHDGFKKQNLWINYIVNNKTFNNEFSFENSTNSSINVDNDITLVIQEFFRFFPSILTTTTCNCNKQDKYENEMMIVYRANRNIRQNLEFDLDDYFAGLYIHNCSQCHEKIPLENYTFNFNAIISINLNFDEPAEFDKLSKEEKEKMSRQKREEYQMNLIPLQEIPKYINIRGEQFKLIAVIHNIPGHFTCYVIGANNKIIEIDDVPLHNKTRDVSLYTKVNPKVLFYMKVSIIGLNEQHVIQNEEKDAHDFSYNEVAILEDQQEQDAENEDDIREQDVDDENTLQRPINVDTLLVRKPYDAEDIIRMLEEQPEDVEKYRIAPGQFKMPLSSFNVPHYAEASFIKTFGGQLLDYDRKKISFVRRARYELRHRNRYACRTKYVLFLAKEKIKFDLMHSVQTAIRKNYKKSKITAKDVRDGKAIRNLINDNIAFHMLVTIRTAPAYFRSKSLHAMAMLRQFGMPTFFFTISPVESYAFEMMAFMKNLKRKKNESLIEARDAVLLSQDEKEQLIQEDPVTCSEVFKNKVQEFIRYANDNKGCGLFGANYVTHYTGRREYQTRGTVHAHIILKCLNAPILNRHLQDAEKEENERKVIEFIDRHVTTMNDEENPNHIFHHHVCNNTCFKYKKDVCRFGFPLPPMRETKILHPLTKEEKTEKVKKNFDQIRTTLKNYIKKDRPKQNFDEFLATLKMTEENYIIALRSNLKNVKILYKRSVSSVMTNSYNPTLFEIVGCNHDLQFVANEFEAITYMFKYTMKKDEGMSELLSETVKKCKEGNQDMITCLKQLTSTFYNSSFICAQQAVDEVLGHPATFFSNACQFINTNVPEKRISMRKSSKDIASMEDDDEDICKIDLIEKYANRPSDMENLTLADFVAWWAPNTKKVKDKSERDQSSDDEDSSNSDNEEKKESKMHIIPQYNQSGKYKKRRQPRVIRFVNFKKEKDMANYKREQCMLYYPWRSEETELLNSEAVTARFQAHYGEIIANAAQYSKYTVEELEILRQEVEESLEKEKQAEREQFKREELPEDERIDLGEEIDSVGVKKTKKTSSNIPPYKISYPDLKKKSEIYENLRSANEKQQEICLHLMNKMRRRKPNEPAEMIIVMGSAGVGKSWTINLITQLYNDYYNEFKTTTNENADKPKVLLMGPTGSCAFLINGNTIHSALSIAPRRDYMELGSDTLNTIRSELLDIETVIIDEISMVGCEMRKMVDRRLRQIFNHDEPFGGRNILLFGDLYQLEPVAQKKIFEQTNEGKKNNDVRDYIEEVLTWQQFKFFELTEIVRQKNKDFQEALNHCARGTMTKKHIDLLRTREVTEDQVPVDAFRLFPTNSQVNEYNQKRMQQCPHPLFEVDAIDTIEGKDLSAKEKKTLLDTYQDDVIPETNLVFRVPLKITIRYRIVVNVNVSDGIVNGALGTLMHITFDHQNNPLTLWIRFDNDRVGKKARAEFAEDKKVIITDVKIQADWTPIKRYKTNMTSFKPKIIHEAFRDQFPVLPAEASTIHKSQGQTLSKVCVDFRSGLLKSNDQIYVAISRCDLENLYILGEFKSGSKNLEIDREIRRLRTKAPLQLSYYNFTQIIGSKIIYHNIASFNKYKEDLKRIRWYQKADILVFAEAGVSKIEPDDIHQSFTVIYPTPATTPEQENDNNAISRYLKLKGIIILAKDPSVIKDFTSYNAMTGVNVYNEPWHIDLNTFITDNHFIITGYKSPKVPSGIFITALEEMFKKGKTSNLPIVVIGDFNFDMKKTNVFNSLLLEKGLSNCLGEEKTRETDTQIDIVYSSSPNGHAGVFASHISDHFAVFYQTQYDKNLEVKKRKEIKKEPDDDDENAVQPAKKAKVQKEEIDPSELKFSLFPNSTQAISDDINIKVINLDVHNALAHSFVALYKMFDSKDLNQIPFFRDLPDILKLPKNEQINRYILIVETSDKERFICREEGICNIKGKVETVLKGFLGNYKSIESRKPCTARGCNHIGFEKPFLTIAQKINNVSKEELEKVIEKAIESDRCTACNRMNKKPGYRSYSPLLFIHVNTRSNSKLYLKDFARKINCFNSEFQLLFIIDNSKDKCISYFAQKYDEEKRAITFMKLSDSPQSEDVVKKKVQRVVPSLLCFVRSSLKRKAEEPKIIEKKLKIDESIQQEKEIQEEQQAIQQHLQLQQYQLKSSFFIIPNSIENGIYDLVTDRQYDVTALCTFNSFLHGMTASYLHYDNFSIYIQKNENNFGYFKLMIDLIKMDNIEDRCQKWIAFLYNEFDELESWKVFDNYELISYSMYYQIDKMIEKLLADHSSITSNYECSCGKFNQVKRSYISLRMNNLQQKLMDKISDGISNHFAFKKKSCSICKKQITPNVLLNELIIVLFEWVNSNDKEISLEELFLDDLKTPYGIYQPLFVIKFLENIQHFTCLFNNHGTIIEIDDLPPQSNRINNLDIKVFPIVIVLLKKPN